METQQPTDPEIQSHIRELSVLNFFNIKDKELTSSIVTSAFYLVCGFILTYENVGFTLSLLYISPLYLLPLVFLYYFFKKGGILNFVKSVFETIRQMEQGKIALDGSSESLLQLLRDDFAKKWTDAMQIAAISKEIAATCERVNTLNWQLGHLQKTFERGETGGDAVTETVLSFIRRRYSKNLSELIGSQRLWLSRKTQKIAYGMETFLKRHGKELEDMDAKLARKAATAGNASDPWALKLQKSRLEGHIENLEKMRILGQWHAENSKTELRRQTDPEIQSCIREIREVDSDDHLKLKESLNRWAFRFLAFWVLPISLISVTLFLKTESNLYAYVMGITVMVFLFVAIVVFPIVLFLTPSERTVSDVRNDAIDRILRIESEKISLERTFQTFRSLARADLHTPGVSAAQVAEISKKIDDISIRVRKLRALLVNFYPDLKKNGSRSRWINGMAFRFACKRYVIIIDSLLDSQKRRLSQEASEIADDIRIYLKYHAKELEAMDTELARQEATAENATGQWAIRLQKARLEAHIENLEKMRIRG